MTPWIDVAGWTLVHFLWQGAGIAAIAFLVLRLQRARSPQTRYAVACAALVAMLAAPLVTVGVLSRSPALSTPGLSAAVTVHGGADANAIPDARSILTNLSMARSLSTVQVDTRGVRAWLPLVVLLWMAGVGVLLLRLLGGWWRINRLHRVSREAAPSMWIQTAARIAATLGLSRSVHVVDSPLVDTPTVIGWVKPVILLPVAAFAGLSPLQVEAILAHELAHIRRHDFLVNLLQTCAET